MLPDHEFYLNGSCLMWVLWLLVAARGYVDLAYDNSRYVGQQFRQNSDRYGANTAREAIVSAVQNVNEKVSSPQATQPLHLSP